MSFPSEEIIERFANNKLTDVEKRDLTNWLTENTDNQIVFKKLLKNFYQREASNFEKEFQDFSNKNLEKKIVKKLSFSTQKIILTIAASVAIIFGLFFTMEFRKPNNISEEIDGIILTTGNGKKINLDNKDNSILNFSGLKIFKSEDELNYENNANDIAEWNTISIPNKRTFKLTLSDGTKVYLNSGSELSYPTKFIPKKQRLVKLKGEGYFEVVKNKNAEFIVETAITKTKVFGTKFNVNAYDNNNSEKISLLEGSVGVEKINSGLKIIQPNQQYAYDKSLKEYIIASVNAADAIEWISGKLKFSNTPLEAIAKRLERKYDIKISFANEKLKNKKFTGGFMNENLEQILLILKASNSFEYDFYETDNQLVIK